MHTFFQNVNSFYPLDRSTVINILKDNWCNSIETEPAPNSYFSTFLIDLQKYKAKSKWFMEVDGADKLRPLQIAWNDRNIRHKVGLKSEYKQLRGIVGTRVWKGALGLSPKFLQTKIR